MRQKLIVLPVICIFLFLISIPSVTFSQKIDESCLRKEFNLAGKHSQQTQFYVMKSELINYALDGKRVSKDLYKLYLKWVPATIAQKDGDEFTCVRFTVQIGDAPEATIPALENWSYSLFPGIDEKNQVFGIDHSKFENLKYINSNAIPTDKTYQVFNAFVDFHSFCNVFPERTLEGKGVQDLAKIGQKIVHAAAFSEPPAHQGKISAGSFFKNGEITLEFKGLSAVNDRACALLGVDSGESSFKAIINLMPDVQVVAIGSSHYKGDIYKDLQSNWIQKVVFDEVVVTEATMPMPPNKVNSVVERNTVIRNVSETEFLKD